MCFQSLATSAPGNNPLHMASSVADQWVSCSATMTPVPIALCTLLRFAAPCSERGITDHLGFHVAMRTPFIVPCLAHGRNDRNHRRVPEQGPPRCAARDPPRGKAPFTRPHSTPGVLILRVTPISLQCASSRSLTEAHASFRGPGTSASRCGEPAATQASWLQSVMAPRGRSRPL